MMVSIRQQMQYFGGGTVSFRACTIPQVMENNLNPEELVRIVALKVEAVVAVQVFPHHLHYCVYDHLYNIALLYQLPGLKNKNKTLHVYNITHLTNIPH